MVPGLAIRKQTIELTSIMRPLLATIGRGRKSIIRLCRLSPEATWLMNGMRTRRLVRRAWSHWLSCLIMYVRVRGMTWMAWSTMTTTNSRMSSIMMVSATVVATSLLLAGVDDCGGFVDSDDGLGGVSS